ncbi:MAG: YitT family protein [Eubacteriales bacterium]|nr:YitT family protein [Eubacteriales bacterium]
MKKTIIQYIFLVIGAFIAAFSVENILVPALILDGGIVGVSMIISSLTVIPLGLLTMVINIPFVLMGSKRLGWEFLLRTVIAMGVFSGFLLVFGEMPFFVTKDELLATVFGGILLGCGVGLVIRSGGCLDGTETVAILISQKMNVSVGQVVLMCNIVIYLVAGCLFGLDRGLYSLLTYFIVSRVTDFIHTGLDQGKAVMIITDHGKLIADDIYQTLGRTVTFIKGEGLISGEKTVLYCVITRIELPLIRKIVEKDDYSAFVTISDVSEIVGKHIKSVEAVKEEENASDGI